MWPHSNGAFFDSDGGEVSSPYPSPKIWERGADEKALYHFLLNT